MKRPVFTYLILLLAAVLNSGCSPDMISGPSQKKLGSEGQPPGTLVASEKIIGKYELSDVSRLIYHVSQFNPDPYSDKPGIQRADIKIDHVRQELVVASYQKGKNDANLRMVCQFVAPNGAYEILVKGLRLAKLGKDNNQPIPLYSSVRTASFETRDGHIDTYPLPGSTGGDLGDEALYLNDETLKVLTSYLGEACGSPVGPILPKDVTSLDYTLVRGSPNARASISLNHNDQILYVNVYMEGYPYPPTPVPMPVPHSSSNRVTLSPVALPPAMACSTKMGREDYQRLIKNLANIQFSSKVAPQPYDYMMPHQVPAYLTINRGKESSTHPFEFGSNAILGPSDLRAQLDQLVGLCWAPYGH